LCSQRQPLAKTAPRTITAERDDETGGDEAKVSRAQTKRRQTSAGAAPARGAAHLPLGPIKRQPVQHCDAEQAVRGDAEQPIQRRPQRRLRMNATRIDPGEDDDDGTTGREGAARRAAARRLSS
jgi:hypothetical protein